MLAVTHFKKHIEAAITSYENLFSETNIISSERAADIINIRFVLSKNTQEFEEALEDIQLALDNMKTGWWIFKTGRSRLKKNITQVIIEYQSPLIQSEFNYLSELSGSLKEIKIDLQLNRAESIQTQELKAENSALKQENDYLKKQLAKYHNYSHSDSKIKLFSKSYDAGYLSTQSDNLISVYKRSSSINSS